MPAGAFVARAARVSGRLASATCPAHARWCEGGRRSHARRTSPTRHAASSGGTSTGRVSGSGSTTSATRSPATAPSGNHSLRRTTRATPSLRCIALRNGTPPTVPRTGAPDAPRTAANAAGTSTNNHVR